MPLLPLDIQDLFLREISPIDRIQYSKCNRDAYRAVKSFNIRAYRVVLLPYFNVAEINEFRRLQKLTGMLVSGSTALQFFDRTTYPESDLDLYVEFRGCVVVTDFLQRIGYQYEKHREEIPTLEDALKKVEEVNGMEEANDNPNETGTWEGYLVHGMLGVINFVRRGKKVQVIVCRHCPMAAILSFHSTCVMNIISHSHAYSLYPRATFIERVSKAISHYSTVDSRNDAARNKYSARGWTMINSPPTTEVLRPQSEFRLTPRCVGDSSCWTIPLAPIQGEDGLDLVDSVDPVQGNSWDSMNGSFSIASASDLKFKYCCSNYLPFPKTGVAGENYMDEQLPGMIRKMVDRKLDLKEDTSERVRLLLERVFTNLPPLTDRVERETPIILPTASTVRELSKVLENLFGWFRSDPIVEFNFAVAISTPHVWTNATVYPPPDMPSQYGCPITFYANEEIIESLKLSKIGFKLKDLKGVRRPYLLFRPIGHNYSCKEVQTDTWVERDDLASQAGPSNA